MQASPQCRLKTQPQVGCGAEPPPLQNIQRAGATLFANRSGPPQQKSSETPTAQSRRDDQIALHTNARVPSLLCGNTRHEIIKMCYSSANVSPYCAIDNKSCIHSRPRCCYTTLSAGINLLPPPTRVAPGIVSGAELNAAQTLTTATVVLPIR